MIVDQQQPARRLGQAVCFPGRCRIWSGCTSPPTLTADSGAKRAADRVLPRGPAACAFFVAVAVLMELASRLPLRAGLTVAGIAIGAAGAWCSVNFWRCRHAHCVVTGAGWLALSRGQPRHHQPQPPRPCTHYADVFAGDQRAARVGQCRGPDPHRRNGFVARVRGADEAAGGLVLPDVVPATGHPTAPQVTAQRGAVRAARAPVDIDDYRPLPRGRRFVHRPRSRSRRPPRSPAEVSSRPFSIRTPCQKATWSRICSAAAVGCG